MVCSWRNIYLFANAYQFIIHCEYVTLQCIFAFLFLQIEKEIYLFVILKVIWLRLKLWEVFIYETYRRCRIRFKRILSNYTKNKSNLKKLNLSHKQFTKVLLADINETNPSPLAINNFIIFLITR